MNNVSDKLRVSNSDAPLSQPTTTTAPPSKEPCNVCGSESTVAYQNWWYCEKCFGEMWNFDTLKIPYPPTSPPPSSENTPGWLATKRCKLCGGIATIEFNFAVYCETCFKQAVNIVKESFNCPKMLKAKATFDRAYSLIGGDRRESYGDYTTEAAKIAAIWEGLRGDKPIEARHVPLFMMAMKLLREAHKHKEDNLDDLCGYAGLLAEMEGEQSTN